MNGFDEHMVLGIGANDAKAWLSGVKEWQFDEERGLFEVGSRDRGVVVGQAPPEGADDLPAFSDRSGTRLRKLLKCKDEDEFRERWDAFNVLPKWPGKAGKGDKFPLKAAKAVARRVVLRSRVALLFGGAGGAFGVDVWFQWRSLPGRDIDDEVMGVALPHPSGVNRWWNVVENRLKAEKFLGDLANGGLL